MRTMKLAYISKSFNIFGSIESNRKHRRLFLSHTKKSSEFKGDNIKTICSHRYYYNGEPIEMEQRANELYLAG